VRCCRGDIKGRLRVTTNIGKFRKTDQFVIAGFKESGMLGHEVSKKNGCYKEIKQVLLKPHSHRKPIRQHRQKVRI